MTNDTRAVRTAVDWDAIRARLELCRRAIDGAGQEDDATVLAARARWRHWRRRPNRAAPPAIRWK